MPRQADPQLEQRILEAASRLRARGGEKALTMRAVAKAAGTTTPTVYERYRDRDDILRALRIQTRVDLFSTLQASRTLAQACQSYLEFALDHRHAYEVLYDRFAEPPSLHEPWPSFNFMRERLTKRLGGTPRQHTRLMLSLWSLMHGTAILLIRGGAVGMLRTQMFHACLDAVEVMVVEASRSKGKIWTGPKWPANLILGEEAESKVSYAEDDSNTKSPARLARNKSKPKRSRNLRASA
ncbi:MAG TPA: TetR/AcrR family transcriptional regulator [Candidatus Deferrimicrobiaceae bacterium]|nr:TetR/AcrR family transcriptional regulator [Candidatus Deferrimicrobiaceae bacterium]